MYILDLLLFIGRKLTPNLEKENAGKYVCFFNIFDISYIFHKFKGILWINSF